MSLEMAHKVILPPKKNYIPQFLKQRDINSYFLFPLSFPHSPSPLPSDYEIKCELRVVVQRYNPHIVTLR
jgi:hypothetical protein